MNNYRTINQTDEKQTAAEHEAIILHYLNTGELDRDDAIKKYKNFNYTHSEYYTGISVAAAATNSLCPIENLPNNVIVDNLNAQLLYLTGKNLLDNQSNG